MAVKLTTLEHFTMLAQRCKTEIDIVEAKIPTVVSSLENDAGYITESDVNTAIANSGMMSRVTVTSKDNIDTTAPDADRYIYMVPVDNGSGDNYYEEYMVINGNLELVGTTDIDLTNYLQQNDAATTDEVTNALNSVFGTPAT